MSTVVGGVRPNESSFYYRLVGRDDSLDPHAVPPDLLVSFPTVSFTTPLAAPRILEVPQALFVKASSVVMFDQLNPENAETEYFFEYGAGDALAKCPRGTGKESCPGVASTAVLKSSVYGKTGATAEATGLQPNTEYSYRLCAESENSAKTEKLRTIGPEGHFRTLPSPSPSVETGSYSAVTPTGATISGTVNPDGAPATYAFELGIYNGASTQYGVVASGAVGGTEPVEESLQLTGLQPGITYAYRITVKSGYSEAVGQTMTFTTQGLPEVLATPSVLPMLALPKIAFPNVLGKPAPKCKHGYTRDKQGKCVKAKPKKKQKKPRASKSVVKRHVRR